ncbi:MAG: sulfite exporter TauE/SafE family protein [bacterium]
MQNLLFILTILFLTSAVIGFIANLVGLGGGILLVPFFIFYMHLSPVESSGLSLSTIIFSSTSGTIKHLKEKIINKKLFKLLAGFVTSGVIIGSIASKYVNVSEFKIFFAFIVVIIGIFSLYSTNKQTKKTENIAANQPKNVDNNTTGLGNLQLPHPKTTAVFSLIAGFFSGFAGIGMGVIAGTFLTSIEQIPPRIAFATILAAMILTSVIGVTIHFSYFKINGIILSYIISLAAGAITGSQLGSITPRILSSRTLRLYQGWIITGFGLLMMAMRFIK